MNAKTVCSISVLTVALTLGAMSGSAQVPPQSGVDGGHNGASRSIVSTDLQELTFTSTTIPATGSLWACVATCSVQAGFPGGVDVDGRLVLAHEGGVVVGTERKFELNDNRGIEDPEVIEVSTTGTVNNLGAGTHRLSCRAAKTEAPDPNFTIQRSSITVSCSDHHL